MATPSRTFLLACAIGFSAVLVPASAAGARPGQDVGATIAGAGAATSTTVVASTTTTGPSQGNQTLVETEEQPEQRLFTESRKVAAVIAGLVCVALALLVLTLRYWRLTKPVDGGHDDGDRAADPSATTAVLDLDDEPIFVMEPEAKPVPVPEAVSEAAAAVAVAADPLVGGQGTDHGAADADWEPRTGEHQRVEIPARPTTARPSVAARRKALGLTEPT